jgi:hypothetical protein
MPCVNDVQVEMPCANDDVLVMDFYVVDARDCGFDLCTIDGRRGVCPCHFLVCLK